ncbi:MAG: tetratricopeptide repeat protein [Desulfosarcinaceae bacterium]|nr:tetratricopeptide repeat protein [Desulfosarcinaceae bacterium]
MSEAKAPVTIQEWFEEGVRCFHKPDGVAAVQALEKVVDMDPAYRHPNGDNPYFYLGKINEVEGNLERAVILYSRALAVAANDEESLIGRGSCYTVLKRHTDAITDFCRVLDFPEPQRRVARQHLLYAIAENYRQLEDWGQAIHWGKLALAADPDDERHQELVRQAKTKVGLEEG